MLSIETEARLARILITLAEGERIVELSRQMLSDNYDFDAYSVFCRIDTEGKNRVNASNIVDFLKSKGIYCSQTEARFIILFYDEDNDECLSFNEFINFIQSPISVERMRNACSLNNKLSFNVEYSLLKVFEKELELVRKVMMMIKDLQIRLDYNVHDIYHSLKSWNCITMESIQSFLKRNNVTYIHADVIAMMKRMDITKNGRVDICELHSLLEFGKSKCECCDEHCSHNTPYQHNKVNSNHLSLRLSPQRLHSPTTHTPPQEQHNGILHASCIREPHSRYMQIQRSKFIDYMSLLMQLESKIEELKMNLTLRADFNVEDAFSMFSHTGNSFLTETDINYGLRYLSIYPTPNDIHLLIKRFSSTKESTLTYKDFFYMLTPLDKPYRDIMQHRSPIRSTKQQDVFMLNTKLLFKQLLMQIIECENKLNYIRSDCSGMRCRLREIYSDIDMNSKGKVCESDLNAFLMRMGLHVTLKDVQLLLSRLDKNRDGYVDYWELDEEFRE